jgi:DNA repair protein RadC
MNASTIVRLKTGMLSGSREMTRPRSVATSWSTHSAPPLFRPVLNERSVGLDQRPGVAADRADRLAALHEMTDEGDRLRHLAELVRVDHPAGQYQRVASRADVEMTAEMKAAASMLGIVLHDHLVIGNGRHVSFRREGLL